MRSGRKESHIKMNDHYGDLCLQPTSGDCNPPDNYEIVMKTASDAKCSAEYRRFLIDGKGKIYHKCSNKIVCSKPDWNGVQYPEAARRLVLSDNCPEDIAKHKRNRLERVPL
ncbi:hypothetical protein AC249_AIPGENE7302 [Exaiptasia diaphana]|nr:hypothetical protein AC249_AIPGENE7302 [Exaiptasia diaphana]